MDGPDRPVPPRHTPAEAARARQLVVTRRRATGLLVVVTLIFVGSTLAAPHARWLVWVQATSVASMVGGLADWFAVTALFRRPLGLPIPHTAIVVERKDRFAETIGAFVQESFLTADAVNTRLRAAGALPRAAAWLADEDNADRLAGRAVQVLAGATDLLQDDDVHEVIDQLLRERLERIALSPVAGRALDHLVRDGRHEPVLDVGLQALSDYLSANGPELHARLGARSPWWLPGSVSNRLVTRLLDRTQEVTAEMALDRHHPLRRQLTSALEHLAAQLQSDPVMRQRGEEFKADLLAQPTVRHLAANVWDDVKTELRTQADAPASPLRRRLAGSIRRTGERLQADPQLRGAAERSVETVVATVLGNFGGELKGLVTGTIGRWDGAETSSRLELLLGPDLQFIRINGTVVGALAGLVLHAVARYA